ncbi:unnamed protein product [Polarella glacialis]|uniref:mitogen-activated protein kinase kinase n=1 Tax=Polarella glacialis TaxID=89957 RepID=A0A813KTB9_POLGL|nr:unnamed protein product [Polarella glacialis]
MPPAGMMLDLDDVDDDNSVSMTWSIDPSGTMRHKRTGMQVSSESGITFEGQEYKLSPEDIELDQSSHLGAGACGIVMKGIIKKTGMPVAVKTVKVDDKLKREQLLNEIRGLISAEGSPNLVQWYAGFMSKRTNMVHVALEFMDLGSLADLKRRAGVRDGTGVPSDYLSSITRQITLGLAYLHERKLLHRDIKPENILHNRAGEVKLSDFGIAKDLDKTIAMAGTFVGTVTYMSPERCLGQDYSFASDIWSVGMVIFELSTGRYPFADIASFPVLFQHLCEMPEPRLDPSLCPPALVDFAGVCLTRDVARRPDTDVLLLHDYVMVDVCTQEKLAEWLVSISGPA